MFYKKAFRQITTEGPREGGGEGEMGVYTLLKCVATYLEKLAAIMLLPTKLEIVTSGTTPEILPVSGIIQLLLILELNPVGMSTSPSILMVVLGCLT